MTRAAAARPPPRADALRRVRRHRRRLGAEAERRGLAAGVAALMEDRRQALVLRVVAERDYARSTVAGAIPLIHDPSRRIAAAYAVEKTPTWLFLDARQRVRAR